MLDIMMNETASLAAPPSRLPPPMDTIEVDTASDEEDSVASSVSYDQDDDETDFREQHWESSSPRSIFGSYWKQEGVSRNSKNGSSARPRMASPRSVLPSYHHHHHPLWLELAQELPELQEKETIPVDPNAYYEDTIANIEQEEGPAASRRSSAPNLHRRHFHSLLRGGIVSDSVLVQASPGPSCLRKGRFGGPLKSRTPKSTKHQHQYGVRFEPRIQVRQFERPQELFASQGWSRWFT